MRERVREREGGGRREGDKKISCCFQREKMGGKGKWGEDVRRIQV